MRRNASEVRQDFRFRPFVHVNSKRRSGRNGCTPGSLFTVAGGWHLGCVAWFRMRNGFNITNKTSARSCAGNSGQKFWRILEAFRRITGGMGTDSYLVRNLRTGDQPISGPIDASEAARILLPSPSPPQGYGLMCLRSGAQPVVCPTALSSQPSSLHSQSYEQIVRRFRQRNETKRPYSDKPQQQLKPENTK